MFKFNNYLLQQLVTLFPPLYHENYQSNFSRINGRLIKCIYKAHVFLESTYI